MRDLYGNTISLLQLCRKRIYEPAPARIPYGFKAAPPLARGGWLRIAQPALSRAVQDMEVKLGRAAPRPQPPQSQPQAATKAPSHAGRHHAPSGVAVQSG